MSGQQNMKTHTIENNTYAIFQKEEKSGVWMLHFIWGKKDFRLYLDAKSGGGHALHGAETLHTAEGKDVFATRLQYLNAFEWYDYKKVAGHGLSREEVCWMREKTRRYVELPQNFLGVAMELACLEFGLSPKPRAKAG